MPTVSAPYAQGTITSVSGTTVVVSGGASAAWIGRCIRMQNGTAQGDIRNITAVASATTITVDYAWNISPYSQYGFTESLPTTGNTFVISHFLDDIDDGTTLVKDTQSRYFRLVAGEQLNMNGGSWLYDSSKTFEFDSNGIQCDNPNGCFRFGDIDSLGTVFNGCTLIDRSSGSAGGWADAVANQPDMHVYAGIINVPATGNATFWRLHRDANIIVRIDGVYVDGQFGGRIMGSRSIEKDWKVYNNQSSIGAFNPKSPLGKIANIQVVGSLQALYHFWTESLSTEAEGITAKNISRLVRFTASAVTETGYTLELKDNDIEALQALPALYQNDFTVNSPGNTFRLSQFLNVRIPDASGVNITNSARVIISDVTNATVADLVTSIGTVPKQTLRYKDMSVITSGLFTWVSAGGTTYAPYAIAMVSYGYIPTTLPLPLLTSQDVSLIALTDTNITLSATAAAVLSSKFSIDGSGNITVTESANLDELYDYAAIWITQSSSNLLVAGMGQFLIKGVGTELQLTKNITINLGVTLNNGTKFKTLSTTGTVTNNGAISNLSITGNVTQATATNLSNVTISGSLTYNDNTSKSVTFTNAVIGTIQNSGTGIITITKVGTTSITTYTDAEINYLDSTLSFDGITSLTFYPTQADRDSGTNAGATASASPYNFKFGSTVNGVLLSGTVYVRINASGVLFLGEVNLVLGDNALSLSDNALLQAIVQKLDKSANNLTIVNEGVKKASLLVPHNTDLS